EPDGLDADAGAAGDLPDGHARRSHLLTSGLVYTLYLTTGSRGFATCFRRSLIRGVLTRAAASGRGASQETTPPPGRGGGAAEVPAGTDSLLGVLNLGRLDPLLAVLLRDRAGHAALLLVAAADVIVPVLLLALVQEVVGDRLVPLLDLDGG